MAVQIAKILGAGRVIAAGRNVHVLSTLRDLGADAIIQLEKSDEILTDKFAREIRDTGLHVILDYLWGRPVEALLSAITHSEFSVVTSETRLVQVGESAGLTISLPAAVLRSAALTILGTAGIPSRDVLEDAFQKVVACAASGQLRINTERVPLADIEGAWQREVRSGCRLVIIP